ncbi:ExbD/TolR family protein [Pleionea mediterranea]|jgi:biopolymer transport protein ExbD|uniref:Outer membrane transport energization protein ExbD n=1 Tax=Pleionea mediterranea TaxID=523701 RepID=A0A316G3Y9_9GAMM|nr:biopolymer transporter ExbD [Pleionea mediterranea]PWK54500.1 outer membrane transport energization protein ExbD [Pleionea mediterranea]
MAKQVAKRKEEDAEIDMTPMLDIVFIMLIFFIVTASFVKEAGVKVNNPAGLTATARPDANVFIAITKEGEVHIDNKNIDVDKLKVEIQRIKQETPEGSIVIQADRDSKAGVVMKVLDAAKGAGVKAVSVAATRN